jgi:hypothetical protein
MRRIDFHPSADTKPWIASGRSWATRTRSSSNSTRTPSVVFGVRRYARASRRPPPPTASPRTTSSSSTAPTAVRGQPKVRWPTHPPRPSARLARKRRPTRRRATSSASPPPKVEGAHGQLQHRARPAGTDPLGPKLVHTSARPTTTEKRAPRLPCSPTAWRSTAAGSGPPASRVSATPAGLLSQGCLAEVVPRTHPRIPVDQLPGTQKRRPPVAQEPTGPGQALAGQLVLPAHTRCASDPHTISDSRSGCWLAASYSEGSATSAVGNNAKPTSSTNAPARPMLRIARRTCHQRRVRLAQGHPCRNCTTSLDGRTSVDQEPQGAW